MSIPNVGNIKQLTHILQLKKASPKSPLLDLIANTAKTISNNKRDLENDSTKTPSMQTLVFGKSSEVLIMGVMKQLDSEVASNFKTIESYKNKIASSIEFKDTVDLMGAARVSDAIPDKAAFRKLVREGSISASRMAILDEASQIKFDIDPQGQTMKTAVDNVSRSALGKDFESYESTKSYQAALHQYGETLISTLAGIDKVVDPIQNSMVEI